MNKVITLSREFGSGGRELGRRLAEELGFAYYDKEIVGEIAKRTELSEQYVQSIVDHKPTMSFPIHIVSSFQTVNTIQLQQNNSVYLEQCNILNEMVDKSNCLIVGRCADYILRERHPFRLFVYADTESKMARCRRKDPDYQQTDKELMKWIKQLDKNRANYYEFYTGQKWGAPLNYDFCVNTSNFEIKELVPVIAAMFR